ncbi:hypothetical protein [Leifsonia virtsii]|uniref:Uncharacterized protein n=1 Tax=Leifsonia virtsii TaxID=3035915 RepID=A0ABT8IYH8_9MICO|nr:hypothetical protein [Leifsonia virtsii]MDN4597855.1 hypothetical protein [Leifsonia virtsii]
MNIATTIQQRGRHIDGTMASAQLQINRAVPVTATPAVVGLGAAVLGVFGIGFAVGQAAGR